MRIKSLQLSNILSFQYFEDIDAAPKLSFEDSLNILIGENGAGKSTALEAINLIFKRVIFPRFGMNQDYIDKRRSLTGTIRRQTISQDDTLSFAGYRLDPNWETQDDAQTIRAVIELDDVDSENIALIERYKSEIQHAATQYSSISTTEISKPQKVFQLTLHLNKVEKTFALDVTPSNTDPGFLYLKNYNFYKELINLHNLDNPTKQIPPLFESFALIGGYRNYNAFNPTVSLRDSGASTQIQGIRDNEYARSLNSSEPSEPAIFNLVRLLIAEKHYDLSQKALGPDERETEANNVPFLKSINARLRIINLECKIRLNDARTWAYSFEFFDTTRNSSIDDINSLSAGQKAIIHLVFEAYGRGNLKGGLVIIDEPEIHLHYQFQNEYLHVIDEMNREQKCQYILVTHSESLINSTTIGHVKRFARDENFHTYVSSPTLTTSQRNLIKILDNTRSTYAFFARKIILVEGDTDRYFFKAILKELSLNTNQDIAVLDINGKGSYEEWRAFFASFGLKVYYIGDFDNVFDFSFAGSPLTSTTLDAIINDLGQAKLGSLDASEVANLSRRYNELISDPNFLVTPQINLWQPLMSTFKNLSRTTSGERTLKVKELDPDIESRIDAKYSENVYILKAGAIEAYTNTAHKKLDQVIKFCEDELVNWLATNPNAIEIKQILTTIADD